MSRARRALAWARRNATDILIGLCLALAAVGIFRVETFRDDSLRRICESSNDARAQVRAEFVDLKEAVLIPISERVALTIRDGEPARGLLLDYVDYLEARIETIDERIVPTDCDAI